jgi:hypothetical protein
VLHLAQLCLCGARRADLQLLVDLAGVGIDDWDAKVFGNIQADGRLSNGGGTGEDDERFIRKP